MKKFIIKICILYILIVSVLFPIKLIKELPNFQLEKLGLEKNQIKWTTFNNQKSCDVLFLGSSKMYCSINPVVFKSITHLNSYNLGTGSQSIIESYIYLKQANCRKKIKYVVLDLFFNSFNRIDFMHMRKNANYLDFEFSKELFIKTGVSKNIFCDLFPLLEDANYLNEVFWFTKDRPANNSYTPWDHGFLHSKSQAVLKNPSSKPRMLDKVEIENLEILDLIVEYCRTNHIYLVLTNLPQGLNRDQSKIENDFFFDYTKKYTKHTKFVYFSSYPNLVPKEVQSDEFHLNDFGAELCTKRLAHFFNDTLRLHDGPNVSKLNCD